MNFSRKVLALLKSLINSIFNLETISINAQFNKPRSLFSFLIEISVYNKAPKCLSFVDYGRNKDSPKGITNLPQLASIFFNEFGKMFLLEIYIRHSEIFQAPNRTINIDLINSWVETNFLWNGTDSSRFIYYRELFLEHPHVTICKDE